MDVGGANGGGGFERPARFLPTKMEEYPVEVTQFTSMKELIQDAHCGSQARPAHLSHKSGYTGFQPRCPPANVGSAEWAEISAPSLAAVAAPPAPGAPPPA